MGTLFYSLTLLLVASVVSELHAQTETTVTMTVTATADTAHGDRAFGGSITLDHARAVDVTHAVGDTTLRGAPVLVRGVIADVCRKKGCWLVVDDGRSQMRVTFKDYAFFVPMDSDGRHVLIEGVVTAQEISEEDARHYAGESKNAAQQPDEIHGPQKVVSMEATAVIIEGE